MSSNKIEISVKDIPEIIETLKEAEKEIEFERKSKNLFIDDLYKVCEISLKQDKEIERQSKMLINRDKELLKFDDELKEKGKEIERLQKELEEYKKDFKETNDYALKLHSIIKEKDNQINESIENKTDYTQVNILEMKNELKEFDINLEDIEENVYLFNNINEAVEKMKVATLKNRFEVVLNNNLIETKDKYTGFRTILGCRISYDNLDRNISFIVREDTKPSYEELENQLQQKENIIKEVREYIEDNSKEGPIKDKRYFYSPEQANDILEILEKVGDIK